jgi:hypothetical protein
MKQIHPTNQLTPEFMDEEPTGPTEPSCDAPSAMKQLKAQKLEEFYRQALATADPLQAMLLMRTATMLEFSGRIMDEMRAGANLAGGLLPLLAEDPTPPHMALQLERQGERFMQIA